MSSETEHLHGAHDETGSLRWCAECEEWVGAVDWQEHRDHGDHWIDIDDVSSVVLAELRNAKVRVDDGDPVLELPNGGAIRLRVGVREWTHERPERGEAIAMHVEVDADDHAWWMLYPERSEAGAVPTEREFPEISIAPEIDGGTDE